MGLSSLPGAAVWGLACGSVCWYALADNTLGYKLFSTLTYNSIGTGRWLQTDPALAWAVDATSNPYSVYTHAAGLLGAALAAVFAIGLASAAVGYILWDYKVQPDSAELCDISVVNCSLPQMPQELMT